VDGLKTGYVSQAGYHLVATARREDQRFIAVVMGAKNPKVREREALRLLNYGFRNYVSLPLFEKGQVLLQLPIWKGTAEKVALVAAKSEVITVPLPLRNFVSRQFEAPEKLLAPIRRGEHLGKVLITANDKVLKSIALVADREVLQGNFLKRTVDTIVLQCKAHNMPLISVIILSAVVPSFLWCKSRRRKNRRSQNHYLPV
jgi:D-alanyl-D-alanine carboxypeptidase (penicillin-binding protein 5/6)